MSEMIFVVVLDFPDTAITGQSVVPDVCDTSAFIVWLRLYIVGRNYALVLL